VWKKYDVVIRVRDRLMANLPTSFGALKHIAKRQLLEEKKEPTEEEIELRAEELLGELPEETAEEKPEVVLLAFQRDQNGLYLMERNIKGLLKEAGRRLHIRGCRDAINHGVFVKPEKIYLTRNGKPITHADGIIKTGIRGIVKRQIITALKRAEYVTKPELRFQLWIVKSEARRLFTEKTLEEMWNLAEEIGLAGDRALGEGKFYVEVKPIPE